MSDPRSMILDLFAGTGSATLPFRECGKHRVIHVDLAPPAEIRCDVRTLPRWVKNEDWTFVWASPPCTEFSQLSNLRKVHGGPGPRPELGMDLVRVTFNIIRELSPPLWLVENVRAAEPYIASEFGPPMFRKDAWCLWGRLPGLFLSTSRRILKCGRITYRKRARYPGLDTHQRQQIPRPISEAVHRAVCEL